jgi:ribonucleoside-triphosphate reductase
VTTALSFQLPEHFIEEYKYRPVDWGNTDAGGNSVGEITFMRTYSRKKPCEHGNIGDECACIKVKERWWEVCRRVIEGMFSIQKDYSKSNRLPWNDRKAQATAQDAYTRLFEFKWTPPGRGLWMMGTGLVNGQKNSAALQNCSFVSTADMTKNDPAEPFAFLMEASMLGVGVGFDTKGADKDFTIYSPSPELDDVIVVEDSREGWVDSLRTKLNSYLIPGKHRPVFDYSAIRAEGEPIKTFGGTAAGPEPLVKLHESLDKILEAQVGKALTSRTIADIGNLIGVCVVSGNVRRSAELLLGSIDDDDFLSLKDYNGAGADRAEWSWMSNNSVAVNVGDDLSKVVDGIAQNGEPGVVWMDVSRKFGRLADAEDNKDWRAQGYNPCAEQTLESYEMCTLVETYINRHDSIEDYKKTLKVAYLYGKTVTLLPTHWKRTNAIMQRNRRIGTSMSGIANFVDAHGLPTLRTWMDQGYKEIQRLDTTYSEWLCVRESIKTTTVKPSGTVSILAGESPGVHWAPGGEYFNRAIRFGKDDPMVELFRDAGYTVEKDVVNADTTVVVYFPIHSGAKRSEADVTLFEKAALAATAQRYWSDNSVSVTLSFDPEAEGQHIGTVLGMYEGQLKTVSFLPMLKQGAYKQMPYTPISREEYFAQTRKLEDVSLSSIYDGGNAADAEGEKYCTTDVCLIKDES